MRTFERFVALGDSTTEGLWDHDGRGSFRGWADRLAERIAAHQGGLLYANLAVRGLKAKKIRETQLEHALALKPDLASVMIGMNDLIAPRFDLDEIVGHLEALERGLLDLKATVLVFTLPDLSSIAPLARIVSHRTRALNDAFRASCAKTGATLIDLALEPVASDPRLWAPDRLHANAEGHERLGHYVSRMLGLPGDDRWAEPLPPPPRRTWRDFARAELDWGKKYLVPWALRVVRGQSSADGITAKRPQLVPVRP